MHSDTHPRPKLDIEAQSDDATGTRERNLENVSPPLLRCLLRAGQTSQAHQKWFDSTSNGDGLGFLMWFLGVGG